MTTQLYHFDLFADYHQFYLQDEAAEGDLSDSWTRAQRTVSWRSRQAQSGSAQFAI